MLVQSMNAPPAGRIIGVMVLSGLVFAGVILQRRLQARILLSQPTPRTGLVGSLGIVESATIFALVSILALLTSVLASVGAAPSEPLMDAARAHSALRLVSNNGATLAVIAGIILAGVAFSGRRSAFVVQLDQARNEYLSSFKHRIAFNRTHALEEDDCATQSLRDTIGRLEVEIAELLSCRPQSGEELDALYHAHTKATEALVSLEMERRSSHIDLYGEEILNGPQDHRLGHLGYVWRSRFGSRHLMRAFGIAGRTVFAAGLTFVYLFVLLASLNQGRTSSQFKTYEADLKPHNLRNSLLTPELLAPELAGWPPAKTDLVPTSGHADQIARPSVESPPEVVPLEAPRELSGSLAGGPRRSDAPARHHPVGLRRLQRALIAKDSFAVSLSLIELGRISEARRILQRLAKNGDHDAALMLGSTYDPLAIEALGSERYNSNPRRAVYWYRKAHRLVR
jgi:hypothetical protein